MKLRKGDWVLDNRGDLGEVDEVNKNADGVVMVYCRWLSHISFQGWEEQGTSWLDIKELTQIDKAVADVIIKSNQEKE